MARPASDNTAQVWKFLRGKGLSPAQAAGVIGAMQQESGQGLNPAAVNPSSGATGIAQWLGGRKNAAVESKQLGPQLRHLWSELQGPERGALQALKGAHTIEDATRAWLMKFERPGPGEQVLGRRVANARNVFNRLSSVGGDPNAAAGGRPRDTPTDGSTRTTTTTTPGVDNSQQRALVALNFLGNKNADVLDFAQQIKQLQDVPGTTETRTVRTPGSSSAGPSRDSASASSGRTLSAHSPVGRKAKVIGTPYSGTHTLGNWQSDNAVDISVPVGTPMVALQDGVVVKVRHHPQNGGRFAGDQITIRGANGNEYFYAHGKASVRPGQRIRKGQKLGTTGSANGVAHLHFGQQRGDPRQHT